MKIILRMIKGRPGFIAGLAILAGSTAAQGQMALPELDCVITPSAQVDLSTPVPGVIESVLVERSDSVNQSQVIARLSAGVERASLELARERAGLQSEIRLGEADYEYDRREKERLESLLQKKVVSFQDVDEARRDANISRWKLQRARDQHKLRQFELRRAEEVLRQKSILSTIDGIVVQRFKSPGEYVEDQPIARIARIDPLYIEAVAPMEMFGRVEVGIAAGVTPEIGRAGQEARVIVVDRMGDAASGTFGIRLEMPNPTHEVPAGQKCRVQLKPGTVAKRPPAKSAEELRPNVMESEEARPTEEHVAAAVPGSRAEAPMPAQLVEAKPDTGTEAIKACKTAGPFGDGHDLERVMERLQAGGISVSRRDEAVSESLGFIVLAPKQADTAATRRLREEFRQKGVRDFMLMGSGDYQGRLSMGVYNGRRYAERRRSELAALDIEVEVVERLRSRPQSWLDLEGPAAIDAGAELDILAPGVPIVEKECPHRTAIAADQHARR